MISKRHALPLAARRTRLTLETPVETPDSIGGAALTYAPLVTLWGAIEALDGRERITGEHLVGETRTRITLRWRPGIDTRMRLAAGGRRFAIRAAFDPDGRRTTLICLCEEISA